jgi:hypothetical protein
VNPRFIIAKGGSQAHPDGRGASLLGRGCGPLATTRREDEVGQNFE